MQIHVVESGDSLFTIANLYGTTVDHLAEANELNPEESLVIGQALVIPIVGSFHYVQPGESLYLISRRYQISIEQLANVNQISIQAPLQIGMRLYIPPQPKREIIALAYLEPFGTTISKSLENAARRNTPYLTFLAMFSYRIDEDGNLHPPPLNNIQQITKENETALTLVITNLKEGSFNSDLIHQFLQNENAQNHLLNQVVEIATKIGYTDIHFDFEFIFPEDREAYNNFLRRAKERLSNHQLLISTALAPKTSATQKGLLYEAHDYATHGEIVDFVVLMTYEWGYSGGPAMAVSPLSEVEKVVSYAVSEIPSEKILLGQNLYGYDWTLPFIKGGPQARAISPQQAIGIARTHNVSIEFDDRAQAPFFTYTDTDGKEHEVWFEDARSIQAKFDLIKRFNLLGIAYWKLGLSFPQNWLLLQDNFQITKKLF